MFSIEWYLLKSIWIYNIFVFPSGAYTNKSERFSTHEQVTYSCPFEKHRFSKLSPLNFTLLFHAWDVEYWSQKHKKTYEMPI